MWLGGVKIDVDYGFAAHSDGDVAIHALIDALLGAAGMGDIGMLFPDNDEQYKGIDSKKLLSNVAKKLASFGFEIAMSMWTNRPPQKNHVLFSPYKNLAEGGKTPGAFRGPKHLALERGHNLKADHHPRKLWGLSGPSQRGTANGQMATPL